MIALDAGVDDGHVGVDPRRTVAESWPCSFVAPTRRIPAGTCTRATTLRMTLAVVAGPMPSSMLDRRSGVTPATAGSGG